MYVLAITQSDYGTHAELIAEMHRLRCRVFRDRLEWDVSVSGDMEIDVYDALRPTYLVELNSNDVVVGCVRFLPTTGPTMLADTFPALLDGSRPPRSPTVFESSRFCVDTARTGETGSQGLRRATGCLFAGMVEWGLSQNLERIVTVTDTRVERILRRVGWPLERIGASRQIGSTETVAGFLEVSETALANLRKATGLSDPVLSRPRAAREAA